MSSATIAASVAANNNAMIARRHRREKEECTNNWQDTDVCHARCEHWSYASSTPIDTWNHEVTRVLVNECTEVPYQATTSIEGTTAFDVSVGVGVMTVAILVLILLKN